MFENSEDGGYTDMETTKDKIIISPDNFSQLIKDWREKVCKLKPSTVTITEENWEFVLMISND
jgi:hypothetical protein